MFMVDTSLVNVRSGYCHWTSPHDKSTLVQVMAWWHQQQAITCANVNPNLSPYGITRSQLVNYLYKFMILS